MVVRRWLSPRTSTSPPPNGWVADHGKAALCEELADALELVEDKLGFHEGSEEVIRPGGKPVVWINAQGPDGDFQTMLEAVRTALNKAGRSTECERCGGTGAVDAAWSGSDPSCPECSGEGVIYG